MPSFVASGDIAIEIHVFASTHATRKAPIGGRSTIAEAASAGGGAQSALEKTSHGFTNPHFVRVGAQHAALKAASLSYSIVTFVVPIREW
jgi:hypothetical protein